MTENEKVLTQINKITQMGQVGINCVMPKATKPALRQALNVQRQEYQSIGTRAKNLAKAKGLSIQDGSKFVHRMSSMAAKSRLGGGNADSKIAGMMIQGNTRGMITGLKNIHQFNGQDGQVSTLSQKLLDCETANIRQMQSFL